MMPPIDVRLYPNHASQRGDTAGVQSLIGDTAAARTEIRSWPAYAPSPLRSLPALAGALQLASVHVQDESQRFGLGSFKSTGGAYAVLCQLAEHVRRFTGHAPDSDTLMHGDVAHVTRDVSVVCASAGNHGRAVAWGARLFGCQSRVYLNASVSEARAAAIQALGATIVRTPGGYDASVEQAARDAEKNGWIVISDTAYAGYTAIPLQIMRGYTVLVAEALASMPVPTHVFVQGGVGGLAGAVAAELTLRFGADGPRVIIVEPAGAACIAESLVKGRRVDLPHVHSIMGGLCCGVMSTVAWDILARTAHGAVTIPDTAVGPTLHYLAGGVGGDPALLAGESGCAGLAALIGCAGGPEARATLELDDAARVLAFITEGPNDPAGFERLTGLSARQETRA